MNFSQPSDFHYVSGSGLNDIQIDNNIMPVKSATDKTIRGMDVAFLMEAIEARRRIAGLTYGSQVFDKGISSSQLSTIGTRWSGLQSPQSARFIEDGTISGGVFTEDIYNPKDFLTLYNGVATEKSIGSLSFGGDEIIRSEIENAYSMLEGADCVSRLKDSTKISTPYSDSYSTHETSINQATWDYVHGIFTAGNQVGCVLVVKGDYNIPQYSPVNWYWISSSVVDAETYTFTVPEDFDGEVELWGAIQVYKQLDGISFTRDLVIKKISDTNTYTPSDTDSVFTEIDNQYGLKGLSSWVVSGGNKSYIGWYRLMAVYPVIKATNRTKWY